MNCKLCLQEKPLLKRSHIIPKFMYKDLFDKKHFMVSVNLFKPDRPKRIPAGLYEKDILCEACDNILLGRLETYASKALYGGKGLKESEAPKFQHSRGPDGSETMEVRNIDYAKFKLFLLSILWRAHISTLSFFSEVKLGKYGEVLRKMILEQDPGEEEDFEICLVYLDSNEIPAKSIIDPRYLKSGGNTSYVILVNQILYHFNISKHNKQSLIQKGRIEKDNTMITGILTGEDANSYFDSYLGKKVRLKKGRS